MLDLSALDIPWWATFILASLLSLGVIVCGLAKILVPSKSEDRLALWRIFINRKELGKRSEGNTDAPGDL